MFADEFAATMLTLFLSRFYAQLVDALLDNIA
jgi:hypothetical protein